MVDRIKSNVSGDPRFFLAQRKFSVRDYTVINTPSNDQFASESSYEALALEEQESLEALAKIQQHSLYNSNSPENTNTSQS
jgi:hypothetical protein